MKNYLHKKVQKYEWRDLRGPSQREVQISIVTDFAPKGGAITKRLVK